MKRIVAILLAASLMVFAAACGGSKAGKGGEGAAGDTVKTASGLKYIELKVGTGPAPQVGQVAVVHYTCWLSNGEKIDGSRDSNKPFEFTLGGGRVIKGWEEGVLSMKIGGHRKLIVPPELGWGARGAGGVVPPNATVLFEVELLSVK